MDTRAAGMDGILNLNKPYGLTSMEVVRRLKKASGSNRVGHGGTLDPVATGVMSICFGQATRVMEYLVDGSKDYRAVIELGVNTDTYDALGRVTDRKDPSGVASADIERALESFRGMIDQVPPMYSAIKRQGKRLYELARAGIEVERAPRRVEVFSIKLTQWSAPLASLEVTCARGFYMRSLAYDLGQALGCGGHLKSLVRLRSGPFEISGALSPSEAEQRFEEDTWREVMYSPDVVLYNLPAVIVGRGLENAIRHGRPLPAVPRAPLPGLSERCRVYGTDGRFIGILKFDAPTRQWQPDKVFALGGC